MSTTTEAMSGRDGHHDWRQAGEAWGRRANDWSCLLEHYSLDVLLAVYSQLGIGNGTRLLDIACGSGLGTRVAAAMGAEVCAIDASSTLTAIASSRTPSAELCTGSMFELPWADESFDAAVSINGIWGGCEAALAEANRVLRPGAPIAISFWGMGPPLDLRECFKVFARHSPREHLGSMKQLNNIGVPGVAEQMLNTSGFVVEQRDRRVSVSEWPDAELAWRALSSMGPAVPALINGDVDAVKRDVLAVIESCRDEQGIYRLRNDHTYVIARKD
ncbi:MAG: methyltransferase domain-containing protein [Acidimicrobiales bacterium]